MNRASKVPSMMYKRVCYRSVRVLSEDNKNQGGVKVTHGFFLGPSCNAPCCRFCPIVVPVEGRSSPSDIAFVAKKMGTRGLSYKLYAVIVPATGIVKFGFHTLLDRWIWLRGTIWKIRQLEMELN